MKTIGRSSWSTSGRSSWSTSGCLLLVGTILAAPSKDRELTLKPVPSDVCEGVYSSRSYLKADPSEVNLMAVVISKRGSAHRLGWGSYGGPMHGVGVFCDGRFVVGWHSASGVQGVTVYELQAGRKLVGEWTNENGVQGKETLQFLKGADE